MNKSTPMQIGEIIDELKTKPLVINGIANVIALNELRKTDNDKFQKITNKLKQRTDGHINENRQLL